MFRNNFVKCAICTYHKKEDEVNLKKIFDSWNYETEMTKGYILPFFDKEISYPYFRRAVLQASNYNKKRVDTDQAVYTRRNSRILT